MKFKNKENYNFAFVWYLIINFYIYNFLMLLTHCSNSIIGEELSLLPELYTILHL